MKMDIIQRYESLEDRENEYVNSIMNWSNHEKKVFTINADEEGLTALRDMIDMKLKQNISSTLTHQQSEYLQLEIKIN